MIYDCKDEFNYYLIYKNIKEQKNINLFMIISNYKQKEIDVDIVTLFTKDIDKNLKGSKFTKNMRKIKYLKNLKKPVTKALDIYSKEEKNIIVKEALIRFKKEFVKGCEKYECNILEQS